MDIKKIQREKYRELRNVLEKVERDKCDRIIFEKVISTSEYADCENLLTYISMGFEVDTLELIEYSLKIGKNVYAPLVTKEKRVMKFFRVNSLEELTLNNMGILEPNSVDEWVGGKSLCICPAIAYDKMGYRIGYGGGYYDNFLGLNHIDTIGIIYDDFIIEKVEIDCYDQSVQKILSDKREIVLKG